MEMSDKNLINLLVKYNNHCNYDDYTKIVNGGLFQNDNFFIFIDNEKKHTKMNMVIKELLYDNPQLIDVDMLELCFYSDGGSFYDVIDYDMLCNDFIIDKLQLTNADIVLVIRK